MIYFVQDEATFHIKIGFTDGKPEDRVAVLQTGCPSRIVLLATAVGDRKTEKELHACFAAHRVVGEWFKPAPEIFQLVLHNWASEHYGVGYSVGFAEGQQVLVGLLLQSPRYVMDRIDELGFDLCVEWDKHQVPHLCAHPYQGVPECRLTFREKIAMRFHESAILESLLESMAK